MQTHRIDEAPPFSDDIEHLSCELDLLEILLRAQVWRAEQVSLGEPAFQGLHISPEEVDALLRHPTAQPRWTTVPLAPQLEGVAEALSVREAARAQRVERTLGAGRTLRLVELQQRFQLTRFDVNAVIIALAPELAERFERIYAYLQDDVTRRSPTVELILSLLCRDERERITARSRFGPQAPLLRHHLAQLVAEHPHRPSTLRNMTLRLAPRVVDYLLGGDQLPAQVAEVARWAAPPEVEVGDLLLGAADRERLSSLLDAAPAEGGPAPIFYLQGRRGSGRASAAAALCAGRGMALLEVNGAAAASPEAQPLRGLCAQLRREAILAGSGILWRGFDLLDPAEAREELLALLAGGPGPLFLTGERGWRPLDIGDPSRVHEIVFPPASALQRRALWARQLTAVGLDAPASAVEAIAAAHQLTPGEIQRAARGARDLGAGRGGVVRAIRENLLHEAARPYSTPSLGALANRLAPWGSWEELVLAPRKKRLLRELESQVRHQDQVLGAWGFKEKLPNGHGITALFAGPPGTGKTLAASILARELGLDIYRIDLSSVVSKYIGETEKHLARAFAEAEGSSAILFFDEADALFGKRSEVKDAHDRFANIETSYLLQRIEAFEGLVILATNLRRNLDPAYVRRLRFIIDFDPPGLEERREIWTRIWPAGAPIAADVDPDLLARRFEITGGHIRNIALAAAFAAAAGDQRITLARVLEASRAELEKVGKVLDDRDFQIPASSGAGRGGRPLPLRRGGPGVIPPEGRSP